LTLEECFDKYERGIYPHPSDCTKFLSCATTDPIDCPAGLHFNPTSSVCDWPADAGCMKVTTPNPDQTPEPPESTESPKPPTPKDSTDAPPSEPSEPKNTSSPPEDEQDLIN
ncbi:peritrophin-1-like, partial [Sitophilus oryzae]|uniref:Peritrophin-1-like n=1 Tax=Sitophilus oryzae TaxID=7048 RepID=A0A6J2YGG9_SITOR